MFVPFFHTHSFGHRVTASLGCIVCPFAFANISASFGLLKYAQQHDLKVSDFINVEITSRKGIKERRIDELLERPNNGDILLVAELSRLGRNMFEVINIINQLSELGRVLDPYRDQIKEYLELGLSLGHIRTVVNRQLEKPISYPSYRYFVRQDAGLLELWQAQR